MFDISLEEFGFSFLFLICFLIVSTVLYVWYMPCMKLPSVRLEHRIPYWFLKRVPLNYAVFQLVIEQAKKYQREGVIAVWLGTPTLFVYGEEIIKNLINEHAINDKPGYYRLFEFAFGSSILTRNGEEWKRKFKMAAPAMHIKALKTYTNLINKHSEVMTEGLLALDGQPTNDTLKMLSVFAMGTIFESNLGTEETSKDELINSIDIIDSATDLMIKRMWTPWLMSDLSLKWIPSARKVDKNLNIQLKDLIQSKLEKIKTTLQSRQESPQASVSDQKLNGKQLKPFGETFVEQHLEDPEVTMEEVTRQVALLFGAAFDTVTHTLEYTLYFLGLHKDVQDQAFEEIMNETEGHITYEDQQRLTYLECVIKESLRMFAAVPAFGRVLNKDVQCGKYTLLKNTSIIVFPFMMHHNPEVFPDPDKFDPERFMGNNPNIKPWNFIPFAEGTRQCMGKNYAMVEMKIILSHILRNFEITTLGSLEEKDFNWCIVLQRTKSLWLQFKPRKH